MLIPDFTPGFARDRKRCSKKHWPLDALDAAIAAVIASDDEPMPPTFNDHGLTGDMNDYRELHINGPRSNWIMLSVISLDRVIFVRTGTHSEVLRR